MAIRGGTCAARPAVNTSPCGQHRRISTTMLRNSSAGQSAYSQGAVIMPVFDFALRLNRAPTDDEIEVLYEVTGGDGDVEWNPDTGYAAVPFNREPDTLAEEPHERTRAALGGLLRASEGHRSSAGSIRVWWATAAPGHPRARPTMTTMNSTRLCRRAPWNWGVCWHWQPRLPDPSYASPALEVVIEDKSGAALAWVFCFPSIVITSARWPGAGTGRLSGETSPAITSYAIRATARQRPAVGQGRLR